MSQTALTPEHWARYGWAEAFVEGATVLDAGCGLGCGTALLAKHAERAVGIDISAPVVAEAAERHGRVASFREGDLCGLPFADRSFDVVVCFETIEQLPEANRALDELRRVLRPDGRLLISSANRGVYPPGNPLHLSEFSSTEFEAELRARFTSVAVYRQVTYFASFLGRDPALRTDDLDHSLEIDVRKMTSGEPGSELYTVAIATDGELPKAEFDRVVLGVPVDYGEQRRLLDHWQQRALRAEMEAAAARIEQDFPRGRQVEE